MASDLIHLTMAFTFFALWAVIWSHRRRQPASRRGQARGGLPISGNIGQR